jgi:hypothetical protein
MANNRYNGRSISYISRDNSAIDSGDREPSWFNDYVDNLEKNSTTRKDDSSTFDQINRILGNKSKYSTVEEAVLDMQKRSGLYDYLKQLKANAEAEKREEPKLFAQIPVLKTYIDNYIKQHPGATVYSIIHDLVRVKPIKDKLPDGDDVPQEIYKYINDKLSEEAAMHPTNEGEDLQLGKVDLSVDDNIAKDNDPFSGCIPNKDLK